MTETQLDIGRGRRQLVVAVTAAAALLLVVGLSALGQTEGSSATAVIGRPIILAALGRLAFAGRIWALRLASILIALLAVAAAIAAISLASQHPLASAVVFAITAVYVAVAVHLWTSRHIRAFIADRGAVRAQSRLSPNER